jgi:hypothetical protein
MSPVYRTGQVMALGSPLAVFPGFAVPVGPTPLGTTTGLETGAPVVGQSIYGWNAAGQPLNMQGQPIAGSLAAPPTSQINPMLTTQLGSANTTLILVGVAAVVVIGAVLYMSSNDSRTRRNPRRRSRRARP